MSLDFWELVLKTITDYELLQKGDRVVVGVSGGPDSMALLAVLRSLKEKYDLTLHVVHVNHMFRGQQAREEAEFVAKMAEKWGLTWSIFERDVPALSKKQGLSPEEAGHKVRHEIYRQVGEKIGATKLALGHHADDRAETILLHLIQGTGLDGLAAMPPRHGWLIRPLARVNKEQILDFCKRESLPYRLDPTNTEDIYLRNKIRLSLLPCLQKEFNPQIVKNLLKLEDIIWAENSFWENLLEKTLPEIMLEQTKDKIKIDLEKFNLLDLALKRRTVRKLYKMLKPEFQNLGYTHVEKVIEICKKKKGLQKFLLPEQVLLKKSYTYFELIQTDKKEKRKPEEGLYLIWEIPGELLLPKQQKLLKAYYSAKPPRLKGDFFKVVLDGDKIKSPLIVRTRQPGDRIRPLGLGGTQKLKDYFINRKIERDVRDLLPLVCQENEIVWLPGLTINDDYKVSPGTKKFIVLELVDREYV